MPNDERRTPKWFFDGLHRFFQFNLDPCTTDDNPLGMPVFFTKEINGLERCWDGARAFVNPPYSRGQMMLWAIKCITECQKGDVFVALLCQNDCSTRWWQYLNAHCWYRWDIPFRIAFDNEPAGAKFASNLFLIGSPFNHVDLWRPIRARKNSGQEKPAKTYRRKAKG